MKKVVILSVIFFSICSLYAQNISQRARSMRMESFVRDEYMVKEIKIYDDTMIVLSTSEYVHYPLGKYNKVDSYINRSNLEWYRNMDYQSFFNDSLRIPVTNIRRLDDSYIDTYSSINTQKMEIIKAYIKDTAVVIRSNVHVGMKKEDVFAAFFKTFPKAYIADINVLRVSSAGNEFAQVFTFKGNKLESISFVTNYRYY